MQQLSNTVFIDPTNPKLEATYGRSPKIAIIRME